MIKEIKISSSSIAEVVIALSVIALCIGIAAIVFLRVIKTTSNFQEMKMQTEIQSELWRTVICNDTILPEHDQLKLEIESRDSLKTLTYLGANDKIIWQQEWIVIEK